jgi:SM-20-related protein
MLRTRRRHDLPDIIARDLEYQGWSVATDAIDPDLGSALRAESERLWDQGDYRPARIGSGTNQHLSTAIRSDRIRWIDEVEPTAAQGQYLAFLDDVRQAINRRTFLGLYEWEGHLAIYPPGTLYRRHLDVFADAQERVVSTVLYLNEGWQPGDGGELRLWTTPAGPRMPVDGPHLDVEPRFGTLVTFLSRDHYHEVLASNCDRFSVTGWFRVRAL